MSTWLIHRFAAHGCLAARRRQARGRCPRACLRRAAKQPRAAKRSAYTLLELMLVLAILVVVSAIAYPSAEAMFAHLRMSQGTDAVREAWAQARAHAIDEGRPYRFAIVPNQGNFRVAPDSPDFWGSNDSAQGGPADQSSGPSYIFSKTLPKGLRFSAPDAPAGAGANPQGESSLPPDSVSPDMWSSRTVFLPDGTASQDVEIVFGAPGTVGLVMKLRALTGAVTVRRRKLP